MPRFLLLAVPLALGLQVPESNVDFETYMDPRPVLVPPPDIRTSEITPHVERELAAARARTSREDASLIALGPAEHLKPSEEFQPSREFQSSERAGQGSDQSQSASLPWGVQSPRTHDNLPVFQYDFQAPFIDFPKEIEYSLEAGDTMKSFSSAQQDVKLITQVLANITNGFYLDTNAGDGEKDSNTLLLEEVGWRGLCMEPRVYWYINLWAKFRKAWLFMGGISPNENATRIGFDNDGNVDMLSGHRVPTYPLTVFLAEMGGRQTIDFWDLNNGGFEAEVLNETLLGSGKGIEFGVIMVTFDGRRTGRGYQPWVQRRSRDETEQAVFEILYEAKFKYIGGLDAYWINTVVPRYHFNDVVFVNPSYFEKRGLAVPQSVKAALPPPLDTPEGSAAVAAWDAGLTYEQEVASMVDYISRSKSAAVATEEMPKAHRVEETKLL